MEMTETGKVVYDRTYSRTKSDGSKESWPETVERVVDGNLALVSSRHHLPGERGDLVRLMQEFKILPAGRHLWASGVKNAQHLFNCWVSGWTEKPSDHFEFTFMRLMEGGGVGANYSNRFLGGYPVVKQELVVYIVCDPEHPDFDLMVEDGLISNDYHPDWAGSFEIEDSREGWAAALVDLIDTFYRDDVQHYHRVYDVSRVRAAGSRLRTFGGTASGPLPLARMLIEVGEILSRVHNEDGGFEWPGQLSGIDAMDIDHAIAQCVVAGGVRRSARMAMMHWSDPQIEEFISIKSATGSHWTTNISVEVDDRFWRAVRSPSEDEAHDILLLLSEGAVNNGEPGMWDSSLSNQGEPNLVQATNPCGEITLEPWEPCNLGHINLAGFVKENGKLDILDLIKAHRLMARFLIRATFSPVGDPKSREVLDRNRRIGVGHFGVASMLSMTGRRFSDAPTDKWFRSLLRSLSEDVDKAAQEFSHQLRIPVPVKKRTVAPTGTIAKMPGVSEGIHPIYSRYFKRRIRFSELDPDQRATAMQYGSDGYTVEPCRYAANTIVVEIPTKDSLVEEVEARYGRRADEIIESASDLTLNQMLSFQALYQTCWADNAVSFTANVDPGEYTAEDVSEQLVKFGGLIKGSTIFPESSMPQAPYERISKEEYEAAAVQAVEDSVDLDCSTGACPIR